MSSRSLIVALPLAFLVGVAIGLAAWQLAGTSDSADRAHGWRRTSKGWEKAEIWWAEESSPSRPRPWQPVALALAEVAVGVAALHCAGRKRQGMSGHNDCQQGDL